MDADLVTFPVDEYADVRMILLIRQTLADINSLQGFMK